VQDVITASIRAGCFFEVALRAAGISAATGWRWKRLGEGRDNEPPVEPYASFAAAIEKAEAEAELYTVASIRSKIPEDGRLALEFARRRWPSRWGKEHKEVTFRTEPKDLTGIGDDVIEEELRRRFAALDDAMA
jgi:hypothetical protein